MTWYEFDHARLVREHSRVLSRYPQFELQRTEYSLSWLGKLNVSVGSVTPQPLTLRVDYPESFPAKCPNAFVLKPELPPDEVGHAWHRWANDGRICYVKPRDWNVATTADEIISKVEDWYFNYVAVKSGLIALMPDIGRAVLIHRQNG